MTVLPNYTTLTNAKPITTDRNTEKQMLDSKAQPNPMKGRTSRKQTNHSIPNTLKRVLIFVVLPACAAWLILSTRSDELVINGFEKLKDVVRKRDERDSILNPIETIQKAFETILSVSKQPYGVTIVYSTKGIEKMTEVDNSKYLEEEVLNNYKEEERTEILRAAKKMVKVMYGNAQPSGVPGGKIELTIAWGTSTTHTSVHINVKHCNIGLTELETRLRRLSAKKTYQPD